MAVQDARRVPLDLPSTVQAIREAAYWIKWRPEFEDPTNGVLQFSTSLNLLTYGERYVVQVVSVAPTYTDVYVTAHLKWGLVDWGRRRNMISKLFNHLPPMPV